VFEARPATTSEGFERVMAVNLLSPFVLAEALLPQLETGAPARIVMTGSSSSDRARIDPDRLALGERWGMVRAYAQSKLALLMATFALAERLDGSGVTTTVVHPGFVATGLVREGGAIGMGWSVLSRFGLSEAQGADTPLHAALDPSFAELSGVYVKKRRPVRPNQQALDPAQCRRVLAEVERLARPWLP
jgi:NAD(P)-dependent dehydrogenase (short-subunit alcohol dehydrogenase family)